jgi:N-acetylneuraminic acid mutarotase
MRAAYFVIGCIACGDGSSSAPNDVAPSDGVQTACETNAPWAKAPDLPLGATQETAVVATGGKLYVLGGFDGAGAVVPAVQVFDPATCKWSMGPALPKAVHHANAAVVDGTIYVVGAMQTGAFTAIPDVWAWNPVTDTAWATRAPMPAGTQRGSGVAGVIDGKIYLAGGLRGGAVNELSMYDPAANTWTGGLPAVPLTRDHGCGGVVNGKLYLLGGRQGGITTQSTTAYEFTPGAGWAERAAMPTARGGTACGVVGNRIVVVGGEGNAAVASGVFPQVEAYDAAANTWATLAMMPVPRHGMGAAAIGDQVYVPGGATKQGFGAVATFEILTP